MTADLVLLGFCGVVGVFVLAVFARLMVILREDAEHQKALEEWLDARRRYREESSLADDSPALRDPKEAA